MGVTEGSARQEYRLLRAGILLFLLALLVGFAVPRFAAPRLGLSAHLLGIMQGMFLMVTGLVWPRLRLTPLMSRLGSWLAVYGCFAAWTANLLAATWAAGNTMLPVAAGPARGSALQEAIIATGLRTGAVSLVAVAMLILWGLRPFAVDQRKE